MDMARYANDVLANMARLQVGERVDDFRVDRIEITEVDYWKLPEQTRRLIEAYADQPCGAANGVLSFNMAISRWKEIQQSMLTQPGAASPEPTKAQLSCGFALYGEPAICTCGTCRAASPETAP